MKLYSHPRSGINYLRALLAEAVTGERSGTTAATGHWSNRFECQVPTLPIFGGHSHFSHKLPGPRIYLYRDGRDVALSLWRTRGFQAVDWRGLSFAEFLRRPLDWYATPGKPSERGLTIAEHWRAHLDSWRGRAACFVRYADLLADSGGELERIARYCAVKLAVVPSEPCDCGPEPSGDYRVSKWRDVFTAEDLAYFHSIVPRDHWGLYD